MSLFHMGIFPLKYYANIVKIIGLTKLMIWSRGIAIIFVLIFLKPFVKETILFLKILKNCTFNNKMRPKTKHNCSLFGNLFLPLYKNGYNHSKYTD